MRIGITQRHLKAEVGADRDALENDYIEYYSKFGIHLIPISNVLADFESFCKDLRIEGFIISGGMGVPATLWGEEIKFPNSFSEKRTETDKKVLDYAIKNNLPVLGVCTGIHYMNVYFKGKLLQKISEETDSKVQHVAKDHTISIIDKDSIEFFGKETVLVNSFHNQAILKEQLSPELIAFAICEGDNTIEAIYHPEHPIAAVTWHPERKSPDEEFNRKIIDAFVNGQLFWKK